MTAIDFTSSQRMQNVPQTVINDWNKKRSVSGKVLSGLVPFIEIVSLFPNVPVELQSDFGSRANDLRWYKINNDYSNAFNQGFNEDGTPKPKSLQGIPLGSFESQLESINKRGGFSVESITVERGSAESFNMNVSIDFEIGDPSSFEDRFELTRLFEFNSPWLIRYGWKSDNKTASTLGFTNDVDLNYKSDSGDMEVNVGPSQLNRTGASFSSTYLVRLYKFDFGFDDRGRIKGKIDLMAPQMASLVENKTAKIQAEINRRLATENPSEGLLPESTGINYIYNFDDDRTVYVSLELLIAMIKNALDKAGATSLLPEVTFRPFETESSVNIQGIISSFFIQNRYLERSDSENNKIRFGNGQYDDYGREDGGRDQAQALLNVNSPAGLFVSADSIKSLLEGSESRTILDFIRNLVNDMAIPSLKLGIRNIANKIEIFLFEIQMGEFVQQFNSSVETGGRTDQNLFTVRYGEPTSLCESMDMTAKIDPNAAETYQIPISIGGSVLDLMTAMVDSGHLSLSAIEGFITGEGGGDENEDNAANRRAAAIGSLRTHFESGNVDFSRFFESLLETGQYQQLGILYSAVSRLHLGSTTDYIKVAADLAKAQNAGDGHDNLYSTLLGLYLKQTSFVIHGTCGLYAFQNILADNQIKGLMGIYNITRVTDQVNSAGFTTNIESSLVKRLDNSSGFVNTTNTSSIASTTPLAQGERDIDLDPVANPFIDVQPVKRESVTTFVTIGDDDILDVNELGITVIRNADGEIIDRINPDDDVTIVNGRGTVIVNLEANPTTDSLDTFDPSGHWRRPPLRRDEHDVDEGELALGDLRVDPITGKAIVALHSYIHEV